MKKVTLLIFLGLLACSQDREADEANIHAVLYNLIQADNNGDLEGVLLSYTDSIEFYPALGDYRFGIENVKANYINLFLNFQFDLETEILETDIFENTALVKGINRGKKVSKIDSSVTRIDDRYIAFFKRTETGWKIDKLFWDLRR